MRQDKPDGALTERARYCANMASILSQRVERYERVFDESRDKNGYSTARVGYEIDKIDGPSNLKRMVVQLRMELLELGRML